MGVCLSVGTWRVSRYPNPRADLDDGLCARTHLSKGGGPKIWKAEGNMFENFLQKARCSAVSLNPDLTQPAPIQPPLCWALKSHKI